MIKDMKSKCIEWIVPNYQIAEDEFKSQSLAIISCYPLTSHPRIQSNHPPTRTAALINETRRGQLFTWTMDCMVDVTWVLVLCNTHAMHCNDELCWLQACTTHWTIAASQHSSVWLSFQFLEHIYVEAISQALQFYYYVTLAMRDFCVARAGWGPCKQ